jgi:hydrogenase maturation factor
MLLVLLSEASTVEQKVHLDVGFLTVIVGTLIPIITALITKANASSAVKALTTLTLTVIAAGIQLIIEANGVVNLRTFLANFAVTYIVAVASYYGLTKHVGTPAVAAVSPNNGIGKVLNYECCNGLW